MLLPEGLHARTQLRHLRLQAAAMRPGMIVLIAAKTSPHQSPRMTVVLELEVQAQRPLLSTVLLASVHKRQAVWSDASVDHWGVLFGFS